MKTYTDYEQKMIIATNLQELISRSGKDQKDIAIELDIKPPTFNQWVTGKATPQVSTLRRVANYFRVPFSYVINSHDDLDFLEHNIEVLPPDISVKYQDLDISSKNEVNQFIESIYEKYIRKITEYKRVKQLDHISNIDDARALIGESVAFNGDATDAEIIQLANSILEFQKKK